MLTPDPTTSEHHRPFFHACRSCGRDKVLAPGDYCRECAVKPNEAVVEEKYLIVLPRTMEQTADTTHIALAYLKAKYARVQSMTCQYVLFFAGDVWREVVVDKQFYLPRVMEGLLERYE